MTQNGNGETPYEARTSEELGRYLVAARDLAPGDLVLTERPLVFGPKSLPDPEASMPCVGCYRPVFTDVGERCSRCGWPVCSGNCRGLTDPRHHGVECHILSARPECVLNNMPDYYSLFRRPSSGRVSRTSRPDSPSSTAYVCLRGLSGREAIPTKNTHDALLPLRCVLLQSVDPDKWKKLSDMQSHMESRLPGSEAYDEANEFIVEYLMNNFINKIDKEVKDKYLPEISSELIHKMCGIIDTNALEIRLLEGAELLALYTNTCIMEHSCIPNTKHTFTQTAKDKNDLYRITVKVVVPVEKGNHITTMYSHALWGTHARRQHLKDTKYFACRCPRCSDPTELGTYLSAMKCLGDGNQMCDGIHLPEDPLDDETDWSCSKCSMKINNSQVNMLVSQMGEEVENVQMMGESVTMLENLLCRLSTFLHPNHYHLYSIKHSLIQLYGRQPSYMSEEILDKKIKMCKDLIDITITLDPGNARLSLYKAVLQHELHSALLLKAKKAKNDGPIKTLEEIKPLLIEAKSAVENALDSLKDDTEETSGKKLFKVIVNSKKDFEKYCKEKKLYL